MNKHLTKLIVLTTILFLSSLVLTIPQTSAQTPKYGGTMIVALATDPSALHPAAGGTPAQMVGAHIYDGLIKINQDLEPVPRLAKSWTISPDGLTYTFNLHENILWHDGEPFTSADVKFSIEQISNVFQPYFSTLIGDKLKSVDTPDDYTAIIRLNQPFEPLMIYLDIYAGIMPKHIFEGTDIMENPSAIGTGPFKFVEWVKGDHVTLVRNENYFLEGLPYLDSIVFKIMPDAASRVLAFEKGEVDYLNYATLPTAEIQRFKEDPNIVVSTRGYESFASVVLLAFNMDREISNNVLVRKAVAYAIDKEAIVELATQGNDKVATSLISSMTAWAHNPNVPKYEHDVNTANDLLDQANYPRGTDGIRFKIGIHYQGTNPQYSKTAEIIREQLKDVGIDVELNARDRSSMIDAVFINRDFDMFLHGIVMGPDPDVMKRQVLGTNIRPVQFTNAAGYNNSVIDQLLADGILEVDRAKRAEIYYQIQDILMDDLPIIPISEMGLSSAWRTEFEGLHAWSGHAFMGIGQDSWSTKGNIHSPSEASMAIVDAKNEIFDLEEQGYNVENALSALENANQALKDGDYDEAYDLAQGAPEATTPPPPDYTLWYIAIIVIVIVVILVAIVLVRRRK